MYRHFGEVLRVVLLQVSFSMPSLKCVSIFRRFGRCDQLWTKFGLSCRTIKITFLEKALYFINVLTKRNNLSHSEAIFICQFPQNMKVGVAGHTFFEKSNEVNFLNSRAILSFHAKFQVIWSTFLFHSLSP